MGVDQIGHSQCLLLIDDVVDLRLLVNIRALLRLQVIHIILQLPILNLNAALRKKALSRFCDRRQECMTYSLLCKLARVLMVRGVV